MRKADSVEREEPPSGGGAPAATGVGSKSFWDIDGYKEVIKRANNSNTQLTQFRKLLDERAQIEAKYAESLSKWAISWKKSTEASPEEASLKSAWLASANEADSLARVHSGVKDNLVRAKQVVSEWQVDNFRKSHRLRDIEKGFKNAQQQWAEYLKRVADRQKKYHSACKDENNIRMQREQNELSEQTEEQKRKWQLKENKAHNEKLRCQEKYSLAVNELHGDKDRYQRDMHNQFGHSQDFERKRLDFMKAVMLEISKYLNVSVYPDYNSIYSNLTSTISHVNVDDDLIAFELRKGPALPFHYPSYQEWSVEMMASKGGGGSMMLSSNQKGVVDGAVALNVGKTIESGVGSFRARTDHSPPTSAAAATNSHKTSTSSSASHLYQVESSVTSNLPPPPVSSPLPQINNTGTENNNNTSSSSTSLSNKNKKQTTTTVASSHFSSSSSSKTVVNGKLGGDAAPSEQRLGVSASSDKSGTLDFTNPFKFNTLRSEDEGDGGDMEGRASGGYSRKTEYENPFSGSSDDDEQQGSDSGDGGGGVRDGLPPRGPPASKTNNQFNLHSVSIPQAAAISSSAGGDDDNYTGGEDHVYSNTNLINSSSVLGTRPQVPPPPDDEPPHSFNSQEDDDVVSSTADEDSSMAGGAAITGVAPGTGARAGYRGDYSDDDDVDEMDVNELRSVPVPNPRIATVPPHNVNNTVNQQRQHSDEDEEESSAADDHGHRVMTSAKTVVTSSSSIRTTTQVVTNSNSRDKMQQQQTLPSARLTGTTEMDRSKARLYPGIPVRALYNYEADEMDEISLEEGDELIKLSEADENGWSYGLLRNRYGLYPASYVEPL